MSDLSPWRNYNEDGFTPTRAHEGQTITLLTDFGVTYTEHPKCSECGKTNYDAPSFKTFKGFRAGAVVTVERVEVHSQAVHEHGRFEGYAQVTTAELRDQEGTMHRFSFEGLKIPAADPLEPS